MKEMMKRYTQYRNSSDSYLKLKRQMPPDRAGDDTEGKNLFATYQVPLYISVCTREFDQIIWERSSPNNPQACKLRNNCG
jgi:hypothetical protein